MGNIKLPLPTGRARRLLWAANLGFWAYFWVSFALASAPFQRDPLGHPSGTGYTFWGIR